MLFIFVIYLYDDFSFNFFYLFLFQVLGKFVYISEKYSNNEEKITVAQSKADSCFSENEELKTKVKPLSGRVRKGSRSYKDFGERGEQLEGLLQIKG